MGYYSKFKLKFNNNEIPLPVQEDIFNYIMESGSKHWYLRTYLSLEEHRWFSRLLPETLVFTEECTWYDYKEELTELVNKFPELEIEVERRGESPTDYEITYFNHNKVENLTPYPALMSLIKQYLPTKELALDYIKKYY